MQRTKENRQWIGATYTDVDEFLTARTQADWTAVVTVAELYDAFDQWCEEHQLDNVGHARYIRVTLFVRLHDRGATSPKPSDEMMSSIESGKSRLCGFRLISASKE